MSTPSSSGKNEFRQRAGGHVQHQQRQERRNSLSASGSNSSSLPRPGPLSIGSPKASAKRSVGTPKSTAKRPIGNGSNHGIGGLGGGGGGGGFGMQQIPMPPLSSYPAAAQRSSSFSSASALHKANMNMNMNSTRASSGGSNNSGGGGSNSSWGSGIGGSGSSHNNNNRAERRASYTAASASAAAAVQASMNSSTHSTSNYGGYGGNSSSSSSNNLNNMNMNNNNNGYSNNGSNSNNNSNNSHGLLNGGGGGGSLNSSLGSGLGLGSASRRDSDNKYAKKPKRKSSGGGYGYDMGKVGKVLSIGLFVYALMMTTLYFSKFSHTKSMLTRLDQPDTLAVIAKVEDLERQLKSSESLKQRAEQLGARSTSKMNAQVNNLERENKLLQDERNKLKDVHMPAASETIDKHSKRETAFMDQVGWLMDASRRESKRMVLERFGPGPHKVEMTFSVGDEKAADGQQKRFKFIIELAPLDVVPHAIHLFLEQVDHGLMDGTHFYLNGPHIVQAGPQPDWDQLDGTDDAFDQYSQDHSKKEKISGRALETIDKYENQVDKANYDKGNGDSSNHGHGGQGDHHGDDDEYDYDGSYYDDEDYEKEDRRTKAFQDLGLDQLAFPDYSAQYPHTAWTIGYTGRPGGPDWYINKVDNTEGHGPGGQYQYALHEQGDSCFGRISPEGSGRKALAGYIYGSDIYGDHSEWHHFIANPIEIISAEILTKEPIIDHHLHLNHLKSQHKIYNHKGHRVRHQGGEAIDENGNALPESHQQTGAEGGNAAAVVEGDAKITHGEGVDPNNIPQRVQDMMKKKGSYSINKVPHRGRMPKIDGATAA